MNIGRVIIAINSLTPRFVTWPSAARRSRIAERIQAKYGFPDCVGVVDGTHVVLDQRPAICGETYWNRKCRYSISLQIVSDDKRRILMFYVSNGLYAFLLEII